MPELDVRIAGRSYRVACAPGGEGALQAAADRLDAEASGLRAQLGQVPDLTLMLMSGLVLADRVSELQAERDALVAELTAVSRRAAPERVVQHIEVPVVPESLTETMAELAARAEALALALESRMPLVTDGKGQTPQG